MLRLNQWMSLLGHLAPACVALLDALPPEQKISTFAQDRVCFALNSSPSSKLPTAYEECCTWAVFLEMCGKRYEQCGSRLANITTLGELTAVGYFLKDGDALKVLCCDKNPCSLKVRGLVNGHVVDSCYQAAKWCTPGEQPIKLGEALLFEHGCGFTYAEGSQWMDLGMPMVTEAASSTPSGPCSSASQTPAIPKPPLGPRPKNAAHRAA